MYDLDFCNSIIVIFSLSLVSVYMYDFFILNTLTIDNFLPFSVFLLPAFLSDIESLFLFYIFTLHVNNESCCNF